MSKPNIEKTNERTEVVQNSGNQENSEQHRQAGQQSHTNDE